MLTDYIRGAMRRATYDWLEDGTNDGEIPGLDGVWANDPMLESCRAELQSTLEDWILFRLTKGGRVSAAARRRPGRDRAARS